MRFPLDLPAASFASHETSVTPSTLIHIDPSMLCEISFPDELQITSRLETPDSSSNQDAIPSQDANLFAPSPTTGIQVPFAGACWVQVGASSVGIGDVVKSAKTSSPNGHFSLEKFESREYVRLPSSLTTSSWLAVPSPMQLPLIGAESVAGLSASRPTNLPSHSSHMSILRSGITGKVKSNLALLMLDELNAMVKSLGSVTPSITIVAFSQSSILHSSAPKDSLISMSQSLSEAGITGTSIHPSWLKPWQSLDCECLMGTPLIWPMLVWSSSHVVFIQLTPSPPLCGAPSRIPILVMLYSRQSAAMETIASISSVESQPSPPEGTMPSRKASRSSLISSDSDQFIQALASTWADFQSSLTRTSKIAWL